MPLRFNDITTEDSFVQYGQSQSYNFTDIGKITEIDLEYGTEIMCFISIALDTVYYSHSRKILGLLDVLGAFGGFKEVFYLVAAVFLGPINAHSFFVSAIQKLFITENTKLKNKTGQIRFNYNQSILLFFSNLFCLRCFFSKSKTDLIFESGQEKIESEFNIVKILKNIRNLRMLTE